MRPKLFGTLALLAVIAVACGTTLSDEEAKSDLERDGVVAVGSGGGGGSGSGALGVGDSSGTGGDTSTGDVSGGTSSGGSTAGGTSTGGPTAAGGAATGGSANQTGGSTGGATDVGVTADTINLGWVGTLTGPVPGIFRGALVGTQAYVNYQNSIG